VNHLDGFRSSPWIDAIGWALLHSLWQGAAVALALACVLGLLRRAGAHARYLAACTSMVLLIALPASTLWRSEAIVSNSSARRALDRASVRFEPSPIPEPNGVAANRRAWVWVLDGPRPFFPAFVAIWTAGIALCALRLSGGWVQARRWVRLDTHPLAGSLIDRLGERMGIRRRVVLLRSSRVEVPMVVGWVRPAILVPIAALSGLTALEMEAILIHELAHIRRHDYLVNLLQCMIETVMFHHPATWWISRVIRREREHCCDDIAVLACRDRLVYARALAAMEGLRAPAFSLSPAASGGNLLARIRRILNPVEESMKPARILVAMFAVMALVPIWMVHAGDQTATDLGSARSEVVRREPFPGRSFADILTQIEEAPTGRVMVGLGILSKQTETGATLGVVHNVAWSYQNSSTALTLSNASPQTRGPIESPAPSAESPTRSSVAILPTAAGVLEDPPSDSEVWAKVAPPSRDHAPSYQVERKNVRIVVEKIADKTDPVRVYPLAGPCQLVHRHYRCTVYFDEVYPNPFHHVDHKVEVVYIDKDTLRRADAPGPAADAARDPNATHRPRVKSRDDQIDQIVRDIEQLKRELQSDRSDQERVLDRLIKELESLKKRRPW
jgi:beta-lactamase regulating signal transducer with metallopeptidase domain